MTLEQKQKIEKALKDYAVWAWKTVNQTGESLELDNGDMLFNYHDYMETRGIRVEDDCDYVYLRGNVMADADAIYQELLERRCWPPVKEELESLRDEWENMENVVCQYAIITQVGNDEDVEVLPLSTSKKEAIEKAKKEWGRFAPKEWKNADVYLTEIGCIDGEPIDEDSDEFLEFWKPLGLPCLSSHDIIFTPSIADKFEGRFQYRIEDQEKLSDDEWTIAMRYVEELYRNGKLKEDAKVDESLGSFALDPKYPNRKVEMIQGWSNIIFLREVPFVSPNYY